jgi:TolB-like protein
MGKQSIAVLPFTDLSPTHDQEYFSDGIAEEILNALAQVKGLKVAGRTSSFQYKGRSGDLRAIARALGVAHVLEGSVRKQGDKVRITAQLIQASDGSHLFSQSYDGDLDDDADQVAHARHLDLLRGRHRQGRQRLGPKQFGQRHQIAAGVR